MKPRIARSVQANAGIEARYRRQLQQLIAEMAGSFEYWITAAYRKEPPRMAGLVVAADANTPADKMQRTITGLGDRWIDKFDTMATTIAENFVKSAYKASQSAMQQSLKDAGWSVEFTMTPVVRDAFQASLAENVGLIKSIPAKYLEQVQGTVMRGYSAGRDLHTMVKELKALYPKAQDRAVLIARDQSNKANAVVNRARQLELGIVEADWMHSHAGKEPRPSHVAANGRRYNIAEGCLIDGEYIQPGEKIGCRCTARPVLPF